MIVEKEKTLPSTITYLCYLNGTTHIENIFKTIPIVKIEDEDGKEVFFMCEGTKNNGEITKPRITLPFYGTSENDTFVICARYNEMSRGIRRGGRCFNNVTAIDLQTCGKNIHVKISHTKLTFTGVLSENMGKQASYNLCNFINMYIQNIKFLQEHPEETRLVLSDFSTYPKIIQSEYKNDIYDKIFHILSIYITDNDVNSFKDFNRKIEDFLQIGEICSENLQPSSFQICTKAFMHDLPTKGEIKLAKLSLFLFSKQLIVIYTNKKPSELLIKYPSEKDPNLYHCINIHKGKKIRHNSPASKEETEKVYGIISGYLIEFFNEQKDFQYYADLIKSS